MRKLHGALQKFLALTLPEWVAPCFIFVVCLFSFGIILSRLGFFQDDWHHVFYAYWQGAQGLQRFLLADRGPFAWIVYVLFFKMLGYSPTAWHWSLMLLRFGTALMFWQAVRQIWPGQNRMTGWLGVLFAVYPIFTLQPLAVAYTLHWVMYLVFMVSLFLMLRAVRNPTTYLPLTLVALLLEAVHLAFIEYFSGLEVCRLVFLWLLLRESPPGARLKRTIKYGLPYLGILALYVVYRSSFSVLFGYDRFTVLATLTDLIRSPLAGLGVILQSLLQDIVYVIVSQWYSAIDPALIDLSRPSTYLIFGSMLGFAASAYFVFRRLGAPDSESDHAGVARQVALGGLVCIVLALIPFWLAGFSIYQKNLLWSERLALAAMPGASMLITGIVYGMTSGNIQRHLALSLLLGLAIGLQVETARNFQASWDKQLQFYWQLHWRAPALQPDTMIVSDEEILFYMGIYPTAFSINLLYPQATTPPAASYWFDAGFEHVDFDNFSAGKPTTFEKYATTFTANAGDVVAITFEPGLDQCLWILGPQYTHVRDLTAPASTWLTVSNASRILQAPETIPPPPIFGTEPQRTWCYYFEKADLASQYQQWGKIVQLWQEASQRGVRARSGVELAPFVSAYARVNDWKTAQELALQAQALPDRSSDMMCDLWRSLDAATQSSAERDRAVALVETKLGCQN